jgi:hypothetical protein
MPLADLLDRLSSPIVIPLHSYLEQTDPHLKLWAMCDTVELLLRRMGSSMEAGRRTVATLLGEEPDAPDDEDEDDAEEASVQVGRPPQAR